MTLADCQSFTSRVAPQKTKSIQETACPVAFCMSKIGDKWRPVIIYLIRKGANRFGVLAKGIEGISKQMQTKLLRELEAGGVLPREVIADVPPRVEYSFTPFGESLFPVIDGMRAWGLAHISDKPANNEEPEKGFAKELTRRNLPQGKAAMDLSTLRYWLRSLFQLDFDERSTATPFSFCRNRTALNDGAPERFGAFGFSRNLRFIKE